MIPNSANSRRNLPHRGRNVYRGARCSPQRNAASSRGQQLASQHPAAADEAVRSDAYSRRNSILEIASQNHLGQAGPSVPIGSSVSATWRRRPDRSPLRLAVRGSQRLDAMRSSAPRHPVRGIHETERARRGVARNGANSISTSSSRCEAVAVA